MRTDQRAAVCGTSGGVGGRTAVDTRVKTRQTAPNGTGVGGRPHDSGSDPEREQKPHFPPLLVTQSWG